MQPDLKSNIDVVKLVRIQPFFVAFVKVTASSNIFGYSLAVIAVAVVVLMCSRYINYKKFCRCVADVMNILLNDNSAIKYRRLRFSEIVLVIRMIFAGFVIVNGFLSSLKSHLTRPIMQIETIEELNRSPLSTNDVS